LEQKLKTIVILATGGTIAGVHTGGAASSYRAGELTAGELIASVAGIERIASLKLHQICNVRSDNMTQNEWLMIAKRINAMAGRGDADGFVITHGTDTMEETAYFLNLVVKTKKPVVLTGSMLPATSISPDGPKNLMQAVCVAASGEAVGRNVMVVFSDGIYGARDVQKQNTVSATAFGQRDLGTQGYILDGIPVFYNNSTKLHTVQSAFDVADVTKLPDVPILYSHVDADTGLLEYALRKSDGVVIAGAGNYGVSAAYIEKTVQYIKKGKPVVIASRVGNGPVYGSASHLAEGFGDAVASGTLTPQKARILLQLSLLQTNDVSRIKENFNSY